VQGLDRLQEVALGHGFDQAPIEIAGQVIAVIILSRVADQGEYGSFGGRLTGFLIADFHGGTDAIELRQLNIHQDQIISALIITFESGQAVMHHMDFIGPCF